MRLPVLVLLVAAAGCAPVGPEFVRPDASTNPDWLEAERELFETDAAELSEWWKRLNDPVLDELVARALAQNNNLKIAGLRVLEAQARDRKSTRLNSSHSGESRMPSSA